MFRFLSLVFLLIGILMILVGFESQRQLFAHGDMLDGRLRKRDTMMNNTALVTELERSDAVKARANLNRLPRFLFFTNGFQLKPASSDFCGGDLLGGKGSACRFRAARNLQPLDNERTANA